MADKQVARVDKLKFSMSKVSSAVKWMLASGVVTFALTGLLTLLTDLNLDPRAYAVVYFLTNIVLFAIAKYKEGGD